MINEKKINRRSRRYGFRLSRLVVAMASVFPITVMAGMIVDGSEKQLNVSSSANGTPLININDANGSGVSRNKFTEFNVDKNGVIFNNSMKDGVAQIGGLTMKNNQLTNEAKVILSEVTGAKGSYLNGTMEVFGRRADLIVANENGITVNGATTLNANNLTLSTGRVNLDQNGNVNLSVNKGNVSVEGAGINTDGLSYFDIVSRSASLSGEISGTADVKVLTGLNDYDTASRSHSVRSNKASDTPKVAISGSHLGSMFGNKIQLISTESGAGVIHTGSIVGNNGIEITADGEIRLASLASNEGNVEVAGKSVFLNKNTQADIGGIIAEGDVILTALAGMEINADVIASTGVIRINADSLLQSAAALLSKNTTRSAGDVSSIQINVADRYQINGSLYAVDSNGKKIANAVITMSQGQYVVKVGSSTIGNASVMTDASLVSLSGDISINAGSLENDRGTIATASGNLVFNLKDSLVNNGIVQANGTLGWSGKNLKNKGIISTSSNMKITLGSLDNSGSMYAKSLSVITNDLTNTGIVIAENGDLSVQLTGDKQSVNTGTLQSSGALSLKGQDLKNQGVINSADKMDVALNQLDNSGAMYASAVRVDVADEFDNDGTIVARAGDISLSIQGDKATSRGIIQAADSIDLKGKTLRNEGTIFASKNLNVDLDGTLENTNTLYAKQITLAAERLENDGRLVASVGDLSLELEGETDSVNRGTLAAKGSVDLKGGSFDNQGIIEATNNLDASLSGALSNSGTMLAISGDITLAGQAFSNEGKVNTASSLNVNVAGDLNNSATGQLYGSSVTVGAGSLSNAGEVLAREEGLSLEVQGAIDNLESGSLLANGSVDLDGSSLNNQGAINTANDLNVTVDELSNSGTMYANTVGAVVDKFANTGSIVARVGEIAVDVLKDMAFNSGTLQARGDISLAGRGFRNEGMVLASQNLDIDLDETLENSASGMLYAQQVTVAAGTLDNDGRVVATSRDLSLQLKGSADNINRGELKAAGAIELDGHNLDNQGTINAADNLDVTVGALENSGVLYGNDILLAADHIVNKGNVLADNALLVVTENAVDNRKNATIQAMDSFALTGGSLSNEGNILTNGDLDITLDKGLINSGTLYGDNITVEADALENYGRFLANSGDLSLQVKGGNETVNTGLLQAAEGDITLTAESLRNEGTVNSYGLLDVNLNSTLKNSGDMFAGNSSIVTKVLQNQGNILIERGNINLDVQGDNGLINSGAIKAKSAEITASGSLTNDGIIGAVDQLNIDVDSLDNQGKIYSQGDMALSLKDELNNSGNNAVISAANGLLLTGETKGTLVINNTHGAIIQSEAGDINVKDVKSLQNSDATIVTNKDLLISGAETVVNDNGTLQGGNVELRNITTLNNSGDNGKIIARSSLSIENVDELKNEHAFITSYGDANFSNINSILNSHGSILAYEDIEFNTANILVNADESVISSSYGSVLFDSVKSVQNLSSAVIEALNKVKSAEGSKQSLDGITFNQVETLENAGKILSNLNVVLNGLDSFVNNGQYAYIQALDMIVSKVNSFINMNYAGIIANNSIKLTEVNDVKNILSITDVMEILDNAATFIQASNIEMDVSKLTNSGYLSQIFGINSNSITANELINEEQANLFSNGLLSIDADVVTNREGSNIAAGNYEIIAHTFVNTGNLSSVSSGGNSKIAAARVDNSKGMINNADYLTIETYLLNNSGSGYIWGRNGLDLQLQGNFNNNDYNTIGSNELLSITTTGYVIIDKRIESYGSVNIDAKSVTNNKAIVSAKNVYLTAENIVNKTNALIFAMNNLVMKATGTILNNVDGNILSQNAIAMTADKIHNQAGIIRSEGNMWLDARLVHNESTYKGVDWDLSTSEVGGATFGEGDGTFWGKKHTVSIIIPGLTSDISLDTRAEISAGGDMMINTQSESAGVLNNEGGLIQASGSIVVKGDVYNSPKYVSITLYDYLNTKLSSNIVLSFSHWDVAWSSKNSHSFSTVYDMMQFLFGSNRGAGNKSTESLEKYFRALKMTANDHVLLNTLMNKIFGETWKAASLDDLQKKWLSVSTIDVGSGGSQMWGPVTEIPKSSEMNLKTMKTYFLPAEKASIVAGKNFVQTDGVFNNGLATELNQGVEANRVVTVNVAGESVETLEQSYEVKFNKKNISEISMGVSTFPTIGKLLKVDSLFDKSPDFIEYIVSQNEKSSDAGSNPEGDVNSQTELNLPENAKGVPTQSGEGDPEAASELGYQAGQSQAAGSSAGSATVSTAQKGTYKIVPMYETRIEMIDQDKFYGSQYFFDSVGYEADNTVIVIGDNYFISELLRRQINESVGTYFTQKYGIDGVDVVQMLFDNAGNQASGLTLTKEGAVSATYSFMSSDPMSTETAVAPLVVGQPLTSDQMAALKQDIVWFVSEKIDGVEVLVPRIYLASSTIKEIAVANETGAAIVYAGQNVVVDADSVNNVNAVISAGNHVVLTAENDINLISSGMNSGIQAGGTVALTSNLGDITSSGSSINAGEHIILSAEQGSVDFIASVGRDNTGNQLIGAFDDGLSAGGSIQMTAQDFDFTAISMDAGNSVVINATEGSVNFNDIHQISSSYEYSHEAKGFLSYRTEETTKIDAESKTNSVNAGDAFVINAAEDVVFKGGDYAGTDLSIVAGGDVKFEASQDIAEVRTIVTESELKFGYNYQVPGANGQGGGSTLDPIKDSSFAGENTGLMSNAVLPMAEDTGNTGSVNNKASAGNMVSQVGEDFYEQYTNDSGYNSTSPDGDTSGTRNKRPGAAPTTPSGSFEAGLQTTTTITTDTSITNKNADFNFSNNAYVEAGNTLDIGGLDLAVGDTGTATLAANDITSTKYVDVHKTTEEVTTTFVGVKGEGHSAVADVISKNVDIGKEAADGKEIDAGLTTASAAGDATNLVFNDWIGGSVSVGWTSTTEKSESTTTSENINHLSGGTINMISKNDTTLKGVAIDANNVNVDVGGDFSLAAAENTFTASSSTETQSANFSVSAGAAPTGAGVGAGVSYNESKSWSNTDATNYTNSEINANNVNVTVKGDMVMEGANINAGQADFDIGGDLTIKSVQDTYSEYSHGYNYGVSVGAAVSTSGVIPTGEANGGAHESHYDSNLTAQQSGIQTTGDVNVKVGGDANLEGAHIISDSQTGSVDVAGDINVTEVYDSIDSGGYSAGGGGGISSKGTVTANGYYNTEDEINYKETQKSTINVDVANDNVNGDINTDANNMSEVTEDSVKAGNDISFTVGGNIKKSKKGNRDSDSTNTNGTSNAGGGGSGSGTQKPGNPEVAKPQTPTVTDNTGTSTQKPGSPEVAKPQIPTVSDNSGSSTHKPGTSEAAKPQTPTVSDNSGTSIQKPGTSEAAKPQTPMVSDNNGTSIQKPGTSESAKPQTPMVSDNSGTSIQKPGTSESAKPQTPMVSDNSGTSIQKPGTSEVAKPQTPEVINNSGTSETTPPSGGNKWPIVEPSKPYVGGTGSASRPGGNNHAGSAKPGGNSPMANGEGNKKSSNNRDEENAASGGKKWPIVTPSDGYAGGPGSASRPGGSNHAGSAKPANNAPSRQQKAADNPGNRDSGESSAGTAKDYSGKKWPEVQPVKPIVGGTGSSSRPDGSNAAGSSKPSNGSPKQAEESTGSQDAGEKS